MVNQVIDKIGRRLFRPLLCKLWMMFSRQLMDAPSTQPIDVIIPVTLKDLRILPLCLEGLKLNCNNKIKDIFLVAKKDNEIINFVKEHHLIFVDENEVLPITKKDINYICKDGRDRSGWLFQQLLKLAGNIGTCENFITIDSDHILLKPHTFLTVDNKFVFYRSCEFHLNYYITRMKLFDTLKIPLLSFISHKMIFNKSELSVMKNELESRMQKKWYNAIIDCIDVDDPSCFSEFETYALSVSNCQYRSLYWNQKELKREDIRNFEFLSKKYNSFLSITFPAYLN